MDSYQANKQNSVFQEIFLVEQQDINSIAAINNALNQAQAATTLSAKLSIIINTLINLSSQIVAPYITYAADGSMTRVTTPFGVLQSDPSYWICWLILGPEATCPDVPNRNPTGNPTTSQLTDYIKITLGVNNSAQLKLAEGVLLKNWKAIVPKVQVLVNADFARIIATNAATILAGAFVASGGNPVSPIQVLKNISAFLGDMRLYKVNNPQLFSALDAEKHKVDETIHQLMAPDEEVCPTRRGDSPEQSTPDSSHSPSILAWQARLEQGPCQNQRLVNIFNLFELQNGTQVFLTDMDNLVNIDIQNRFISGEIPATQADILRASGQDIGAALEAAGSGDLDPMANDLASARADIEGNLQVFRQFFVNAFGTVVERESAMAASEDSKDGPNRPHGQRLGELCMLWLLSSNIPRSNSATLEDWPNETTERLCKQTLYFNVNDNPEVQKESPAFTLSELAKQVGGTPFRSRVCTFHKYKIQNRSRTVYTIAPPRI